MSQNFHREFQNQAAYYDNLDQYENAAEAKSQYEAVFTNVYSEVVDNKLLKVIKRENSRAKNMGYVAATEALEHVAYDQGFNEGFQDAASASAQAAFAATYPKAYQASFDKRAQYLDRNPEIEGIITAIVDSEGKEEFVIGQPITLVIKELNNIGRVGGNLDIVLSESINAKTTTQVTGFAKTRNLEFKNIASIDPTAKLGKQAVQVCVNNTCTKAMIELKWENQIKGLTKAGVDNKAANLLSAFIRGTLLDEWKKVYSDYQGSSSNGRTIYDRLVNVPGQREGQYIVDKKSYLGLFFETMRVNKSIPGFKERVTKIGEEYLALKKAMLDLKLAEEKVRSGGLKIITQLATDTSPKEYRLNQLPEDQQAEALSAYLKQMSEFHQAIEQDPVLKKQMSDCSSKTKKSLVSCVQFMDQEESSFYKGWTLGNTNMIQKLTELNSAAGAGLKK